MSTGADRRDRPDPTLPEPGSLMPSTEVINTELTLITVTHNSAHQLPHFLAAASRFVPPSQIIIVDNASNDETVAVASEAAPSSRVIQNEANLGFGRACNAGALTSSTDWLLFANPDVRLLEVSLPELQLPFGLGASHLRRSGGRSTCAARAEPTPLEEWAQIFYASFLPRLLARPLVSQRQRPAAWASGALLLVRRDEFLSIGGFDRRYFLYMEDRDLGRRYRRAGWPVRIVSGLTGEHIQSASSADVQSSFRVGMALASWLEYIGTWRGQSHADAAARRVLRVLNFIATTGFRRSMPARVRQKAEQSRALWLFLLHLDRNLPGDGYLPHARTALARGDERAVPAPTS